MNTPFSLSPDPRFLYLTAGLTTVVAKINFTIDSRQGLTCLLGDVGMGKTTLLRLVYDDYMGRTDVVCCFLSNPNFYSELAFVKGICTELGIKTKRSMFEQENELKFFLAEQYAIGKNVIVFIDEAQKLTGRMLEQVRAMLNFESNSAKLIQFVLVAQMELLDRLKDPSKKAIRSRIFAPSVLSPLSFEETREMVAYRCQIFNEKNPFPESVLEEVYTCAGGVPRDILHLCAMSYIIMKMEGAASVTSSFLEKAKKEAVLP